MDIYIIRNNLVEHLCNGVSHHIVNGFTSIYEDAVRTDPVNTAKQMKMFIKDIENWPDETVERATNLVIKEFPSIRKVLKTINYINIKSVALINRHSIEINDTYISTKTPPIKRFVHDIYRLTGQELFHDESLMNASLPGTRMKQLRIINGVITRLITSCVPLTDLLERISDEEDPSYMTMQTTLNTDLTSPPTATSYPKAIETVQNGQEQVPINDSDKKTLHHEQEVKDETKEEDNDTNNGTDNIFENTSTSGVDVLLQDESIFRSPGRKLNNFNITPIRRQKK
jgi:hypothetical protein